MTCPFGESEMPLQPVSKPLLIRVAARVKLPGKARPGDAALVVKRLQTSADTLTRREARKAQTMALAGKGVRKPPKPSSRSRAAGSSAYRPESGACADGFWHALWLDSQK